MDDFETILGISGPFFLEKRHVFLTSRGQNLSAWSEVVSYIDELRKDNPKIADIMSSVVYEIEADDNKYRGQSILNIVENIKHECVDKAVTDFCLTWFTSKDEVMYAATHYRNGEIPNESAIKETADFGSYKQSQEKTLPKFKYYSRMMAELRELMKEEIEPLLVR